ncbi:hypothetical protein P4U65_20890 [Bacillus pacificus]|nr:hypothetical protein [Bacillus thuringiensis]MED1302974.1 hypothetical protein [Bacillus pacificus]
MDILIPVSPTNEILNDAEAAVPKLKPFIVELATFFSEYPENSFVLVV